MRALVLCLALAPTALWADDIALESDVSAVTLYPDGATVTRAVPFEMPAGRHRLILTDLPKDTPLERVRVSVSGATMGGITTRADFVPPRSPLKDAVIEAAEAKVKDLEDRLRKGEADVRAIRLEGTAAKARAEFLGRIGSDGGPLPVDADALLNLSAMIKGTTLAALKEAHEADLRADAAYRALDDLRDELDEARQTLDALVPEEEDRALLAVEVSSEAAGSAELTVSYTISDARWLPVYDLMLDREAGALEIERGAFVAQDTGENWQGVALTLSTVRPSEQVAPSVVPPQLRRVFEPEKQEMMPSAAAGLVVDTKVRRMMAVAPVMEADAVSNGISVTYSYPEPVDIASGADRVRLALGTLSATAEVVARAAPMWDSSAFVVADFTNETNEVILPTDEAMFYLDGDFVGRQRIGLIPAGAEEELAFGPVEGLRLSRTVLDRTEGDRGVIRSSNEFEEEVRIEVENLTGEAWPVRLVDRVPYSEQDDLKVTWQAEPQPAETDIDGLRGVMEWRFDLAPGAKQAVSLSHRMTWPEGQILE